MDDSENGRCDCNTEANRRPSSARRDERRPSSGPHVNRCDQPTRGRHTRSSPVARRHNPQPVAHRPPTCLDLPGVVPVHPRHCRRSESRVLFPGDPKHGSWPGRLGWGTHSFVTQHFRRQSFSQHCHDRHRQHPTDGICQDTSSSLSSRIAPRGCSQPLADITPASVPKDAPCVGLGHSRPPHGAAIRAVC